MSVKKKKKINMLVFINMFTFLSQHVCIFYFNSFSVEMSVYLLVLAGDVTALG